MPKNKSAPVSAGVHWNVNAWEDLVFQNRYRVDQGGVIDVLEHAQSAGHDESVKYSHHVRPRLVFRCFVALSLSRLTQEGTACIPLA